jgi:hypothetical protein
MAWKWAAAGALACSLAVSTWMLLLPKQVAPIVARVAAPTVSVAVPQRPSQDAPDQVRNAGRPTSGVVVIAPLMDATVPRDLEVHWRSVAAAVSYDVLILNATGDMVWRTHTTSDRLRIPLSVPLHTGEKYFVLLSANLPSGKTIRAKAIPFFVETKQGNQ